ncbi:hypothetical protein PRZ48_002398 [Zasmidium cellare]|uniref:ATPase AAA-type core domain-containing protein n=1 Tax=Zasmidium cellare TaxID=395010 RepID=A0ABR0F3X9_ZASCE|nr:hypothetical protein PRZ48_002398 [Zasmidium cellare]
MALASIFESFRKHCSAPRTQTDLQLLETIREAHSNKHLTVIASQTCDLLAYAAAGYAQVEFSAAGDKFHRVRTYHAPSNRLDEHNGTLKDDVFFGYFTYVFNSHEFSIYLVKWLDALQGRQSYFYLLSPRSTLDGEGHSLLADSLLTSCGSWTASLHNEIYVFDSGVWSKDHNLFSAIQSASWEDVILEPAIKQSIIHDASSFFECSNIYQQYGVPWKRGIIFHGLPGCGKTMSIKALVNTLGAKNVAALYVKSFDASRGAKFGIRANFTHARAMAPCLLLDSLVVDKVRSYFLNEVDGLESNHGILMIASTNHIDKLDPSISKRPSRFDRKYHFELPGESERLLYCQSWQRKLTKISRIVIDNDLCATVAKSTNGFSFAYLNELFVQATRSLVTDGIHLQDDGQLRGVEQSQEAGLDLRSREAGGVSSSDRLLEILLEQSAALQDDAYGAMDRDVTATSEPQDQTAEVDPKLTEELSQARAWKRANLQI